MDLVALKRQLLKGRLENFLLAILEREVEDEFNTFYRDHAPMGHEALKQAVLEKLEALALESAEEACDAVLRYQRYNQDVSQMQLAQHELDEEQE